MLDLLLTGGAEWFTGVAFLSTLLFSVTVLLMFLGGDGGMDADLDVDLDVPDGSGVDNTAFKILSFQGVIGFGMGWGWGGLVALRSMGWSWNAAAIFGIAIGAIFLRMLWLGFRLVYSLNASGNVRREDAVGHTGIVTVVVPESGSGRVRVVIRNRQREYRATAADHRAIAPQSSVRVTQVRDDGTLEVEPADD
jgi:membrane protein implicated in regulation of membrane protease activity